MSTHVIDGVAKARDGFAPTYEEWLAGMKAATSTPQAFEAWAKQGPTMLATGQMLGIDTSGFELTFSGKLPSPRARATSRQRARAVRSRGSRSNGGGPVTNEQIIAYLAEHPGISAKELARGLGASYDTIQSRLKTLLGEGLITRQGERNQTTWHPALVPAGV